MSTYLNDIVLMISILKKLQKKYNKQKYKNCMQYMKF